MPDVTGFVTDQSHRPIENATIALPNAGLFALSDEKGFFEIDGVPPGITRINVVHRNFQKFVADVHTENDMVIYIDLDSQ